VPHASPHTSGTHSAQTISCRAASTATLTNESGLRGCSQHRVRPLSKENKRVTFRTMALHLEPAACLTQHPAQRGTERSDECVAYRPTASARSPGSIQQVRFSLGTKAAGMRTQVRHCTANSTGASHLASHDRHVHPSCHLPGPAAQQHQCSAACAHAGATASPPCATASPDALCRTMTARLKRWA
jgi:hypothetical protein